MQNNEQPAGQCSKNYHQLQRHLKSGQGLEIKQYRQGKHANS